MIKRLIDIMGATMAGLIFSPIILVVFLLIYFTMEAPVFFKQKRPGLKGNPFYMYKFRTMSNATSADGQLLSDKDRLTKLGRFLRLTSLDELPELFNVFRGEMSLVGPRPLAMIYLERYNSEQARRHDVKPGITGWAQVNGRNAISWEEKFNYDVWYVDHFNIWLDFKILFLTFLQVINRKDVVPEGQSAMQDFMGTVEEVTSINN